MKNNNADLIKSSKDKDLKEIKSSRNTFDEAQQKIYEIIFLLTLNKKTFDHKMFKEKLNTYLETYHRIIYSEISVLIFRFYQDNENENIDNIIQNLTFLANEINLDNEMTIYDKTILKLSDHVLLANNQLSTLATTEETVSPFIKNITVKFNKSLNEQRNQLNNLKDDFKKEIDNKTKEILSQMIAIVSIFVAIAFVMFGGMSLINELFSYVNNTTVPIIELLCLGSLVGIIMISVIYAFMIFILRILNIIEDIEKRPYKLIYHQAIFFLFFICLAMFSLWACKTYLN